MHNLEESKIPDAKRYQAILKAASEEMDLKMAEINGFMRSNEEECQKSPKYHRRMEVTQEEEEKKCANDINTRYEGDETSEQSEEVEKCINAQESEGGESKGSSEESNED